MAAFIILVGVVCFFFGIFASDAFQGVLRRRRERRVEVARAERHAAYLEWRGRAEAIGSINEKTMTFMTGQFRGHDYRHAMRNIGDPPPEC